ncbi:hypothetical protein BEWA_039600 [Theileria equi strain WA]|uniref:Uncharacterized protein n=1 Tax=Theileria equi strain WA TaxID=1537102 RepID=L1LEQ6_THEEQ|nr:hypothetical protein BEWA_039600 [Theileria equi strain WA]EKX73922.1 hypothetical protein BEWA_039600 [Theileria equi strain WA]|eukprot:XP_004833374.1 hypothetical protein BEWA_039600 [Theileria equi strain WA]
MNELIVNIQNKCRSNKRCKCRGNKKYLSVRFGRVKDTNFGYFTHDIGKIHVRDNPIRTVFWQNVELERIGYVSLFDDSASVTVFYNRIYDNDPNAIKKPLLIRSKDNGDKTHWFENIGGYANKRWRGIDEEVGSKKYPKEDDYTGENIDFEKKLEALSCKLFVAHRIHIDFDQNTGYSIKCDICGEQLEIKVNKYSVQDAEGYTKYDYSGTFSENSILVYNGRQLTFQKRSRYKTGYYLPIPVDKENFSGVSAYYWKEDNQKKNPLLIEFVGKNYFSYWMENISIAGKDGNYKHDKWRALPWMHNNPKDLKERLDLLNCIYNGVVQINLGKLEDCHPKRHFLHKNVINRLYEESIGTYPVLYAYKYWSIMGSFKPLIISEVTVKGKLQEFKSTPLPFRDVRLLSAFVSPCDPNIPFLICVEYQNMTHKWYKRNSGDTWEEYTKISGKPNDVKAKLGDVLKEVKTDLTLNECDVITSAESAKIKITHTVGEGKSFSEYFDESGPKKIPIIVSKSRDDPISGFFKNIHKVATKSNIFVLNKMLQDRGEIVATKKINGVQGVEVYFWRGNPTEPILLGITTKNNTPQGSSTYYGTLGTRWGNGQVEKMEKQQALDHQNCMVNKAIPIELTAPTDLERFKSPTNRSSCLNRRSLTTSDAKPNFPDDAKGDYDLDAYHITPNDTMISRVTYENQPTDIVTTKDFISQIRIYKWDKDPKNVPLLVEFVKSSGGFIFFENLGKTAEYKEWKTLHGTVTREFYKNNLSKLTDKFIERLNEVNCKINEVVQLDISGKGGEYCHGLHAGHEKRIKVTIKQEEYSGFIGYEHAPAKGQKFLKVSSIYNGKTRQQVTGFDMPKEISKVTVYFPTCDGASPVSIRVEQNRGETKWLKKIKDNDWEVCTDFESKGNNEIEIALENVKNSIADACGQRPPPPRFTSPDNSSTSQGSRYTTTSVDNGKDDKYTWKEILDDAKIVYEEEKKKEKQDSSVRIDIQEEHEDEELIKGQNEATFMSDPVTVGGVKLNVDGSPPSTTTPTGLRPNSVGVTLSLIIDIEQSIAGKGNIKKYKVSPINQEIKLERDERPDGSGFYMLTHESPDGLSFKIENVKHGDKTISLQSLGIDPNEEIIHLAVWYWKEDKGRNKPLLIEVLKEDGSYIYAHNTGDLKWQQLSEHQNKNSELIGELLEQKLDELNCYHNGVVTMDLTEDHSKKHIDNNYCCKHHSNGRASVTSDSVNANGKSDSPIHYYKHDTSDTSTHLAKIKYYSTGGQKNRKYIRPHGFQFPTSGAVTVYAFYCKDKDPVLIYLDYNGGQNDVKGWYKKDKTNVNKPWIKVLTGVLDPNNIKYCKDKFNELVEVLKEFGCDYYKTCNDDSPSMAQVKLEQSPGVTIQLSKNKDTNVKQITSTYEDPTGKKSIKITRSPYPPGPLKGSQDFLKFIHIQAGPSFKLKEVQDNQNNNINIHEYAKVSSVSSYYWKDDQDVDETNKNPLLIEIDNSGDFKYYENRGNSWSKYDPPPVYVDSSGKLKEIQLLQKLISLNCEINDVVQIDVSEISNYCHYGHSTKKVKVEKMYEGNLGNYVAYTHIPDTGAKFSISSFKNNYDPMTLKDISKHMPIKGVDRVIVYACNEGFYDPLLIYIQSNDPKISDKWFKKPGKDTEWTKVKSPQDDQAYETIVGLLDGIDSTCAPPSVILDIYQRGYHTSKRFFYEDANAQPCKQNISVIPKSNPLGVKDFTECIHTISGRNSYFTVKKFKCGENEIICGLEKTENVTQVSVFYWTPLEAPARMDENRGRPLLVKVTQHYPSGITIQKWYENIDPDENKNWQLISDPTENLESKLHLLNCKLNHAVIVDISKHDTIYDACDNGLDFLHEYKMQVSKDTPGSKVLSYYDSYTHTLNKSSYSIKFHIVGFVNSVTPLSRLPSNILDVKEVKVYRCDKDNKSLMVYIDSSTINNSDKWYKNTSGGTPGHWIIVGDDLASSVTDDTNQYEKILNVLNSLDSSCNPATPETSAKLTGLELATGSALAGYVSSGVFTGAGGLTGLGWWAFKRSKGDPWVRQI